MTTARRLHGDTRGGVERVAVWLVALAVVAGTVGSVAYLADDVRRDTPDAAFAVSFDGDTHTVTVEHAGGDAITDRVTRRLSVVVADADGPTAAKVAWARDAPGPVTRGEGYPVRPGETLTVDDPAVDADGDGSSHDADATVGFRLGANDSVRVVWEGARRGGTVRTVTLANATLG